MIISRMVSSSTGNATVRAVTFLLWAGAAASAAYWGLKISASSPVPPAVAAGIRQPGPVDPAVVARLMGATPGTPVAGSAAPAAAPLSSRFALVGVVADRSSQGAALIAVDGRPARPYRVGSRVDDGLVLQSVQGRRAVLAASADGPAAVTLEMAAPPR